jgi:hypothetical protein
MTNIRVGLDDKPVSNLCSDCRGFMMLITCSGDLEDPKGKADYERGYKRVLEFL